MYLGDWDLTFDYETDCLINNSWEDSALATLPTSIEMLTVERIQSAPCTLMTRFAFGILQAALCLQPSCIHINRRIPPTIAPYTSLKHSSTNTPLRGRHLPILATKAEKPTRQIPSRDLAHHHHAFQLLEQIESPLPLPTGLSSLFLPSFLLQIS